MWPIENCNVQLTFTATPTLSSSFLIRKAQVSNTQVNTVCSKFSAALIKCFFSRVCLNGNKYQADETWLIQLCVVFTSILCWQKKRPFQISIYSSKILKKNQIKARTIRATMLTHLNVSKDKCKFRLHFVHSSSQSSQTLQKHYR